MQADKPSIAILMAVYEPNMDWLREQLLSLEAQTYPNLYLYIREDCSPKTAFADIEQCIAECIKSFPYEIRRNERNLGSNKTFELLTQEADAEYFAYCDQDDVWLPEKLEVLQQEITRQNALLVCSDMFIIDGDGRQVADSMIKVRRHHVFRSGDDLAEKLVFSNFVTGCTMLIKSETAKAAIPFSPYMVHDHYLALFTANQGTIISLPRQLIKYRIHGGNQTEMLAGVTDKASYERIRICEALNKMRWLEDNFCCDEDLQAVITQGRVWLEARQSNWQKRGGAATVWRYRQFGWLTALLEVFAPYLPEWVFGWIIKLKKQNLI